MGLGVQREAVGMTASGLAPVDALQRDGEAASPNQIHGLAAPLPGLPSR
jgi:hypothetical protein